MENFRLKKVVGIKRRRSAPVSAVRRLLQPFNALFTPFHGRRIAFTALFFILPQFRLLALQRHR